MKPACLVETFRCEKTLSALFKSLYENEISVSEERPKVYRPGLKELEALGLDSKEVEEISKDSIICLEVKDNNDRVSKIVEDLNREFSCKNETWFKVFDKKEDLEKIKNWKCTAVFPRTGKA